MNPNAPSILLLPADIDALTSKAHADLHDDLRRGWHAKAVMAGVSQARLAKAFVAADPVHHEGLGQLIGVVEPWIYEEMRRQHGADCWRDKTFRREFFGANPECGVRSRSRRTTVRVDGMRKKAKANIQHPTSNTQHPMAEGAGVCTGRVVCP